jgi:hypothetical protein
MGVPRVAGTTTENPEVGEATTCVHARTCVKSELADFGVANVQPEHVKPPTVCQNSVYTDLLKVPTNCSSVTQRAIFLKQIENSGCRPWTVASDELFDTDSQCPEGHQHFEVWTFTTDAGGDQTVNATNSLGARFILLVGRRFVS